MAKKKATEPDNGAATAEQPQRARQAYLSDEMAPPSFPEIDSVAADFHEAGQTAKRAREREQELGDRLIALMRHHKLWAYRFDEHTVTLEQKNKVKVARNQGD